MINAELRNGIKKKESDHERVTVENYLCAWTLSRLGDDYSLRAEERSACARVNYEDKNQVTPNSITLKTASGRVFDRTSKGDSRPVSSVCIGLFEETTKRLIATATADDQGWFKFKQVHNGTYRLVVTDMYHIFCPANIPIKIDVRSGQKKENWGLHDLTQG